MNHRHLLAAFDVGGRKTEAVLFTEHGDILAHVRGKGGNPLERGLENAAAHYVSILTQLFETGGVSEIDALYGQSPPRNISEAGWRICFAPRSHIPKSFASRVTVAR